MSKRVFFGYASKPNAARESLNAATKLCVKAGINAITWEDLRVQGRVIIRAILDEILKADLCVFDISTLNENVLFELGFAIAKEKRILVLVEKTDREATIRVRDFQLLSKVGYQTWSNSIEIQDAVVELVNSDDHQPLYRDLIEPALQPTVPASIFFMPSGSNTDGTRAVSRRIDHEMHRGVRVVAADPTESSVQPLQWYASKVYETECSVIQFDSSRRSLSEIRNPRAAFVAGLAIGFDRQVLMVAEDEYNPPLDYGDLLYKFSSPKDVATYVDHWLVERNLQPRSGARSQKLKIATELRALRFGEHVAENEIDTLADYYIETSAFEDVLAQRNSLFVGRKGTGKTASMLQAAARLTEDARNLVVVIKPASYEYSSLLALLGSMSGSLQQYFIEALWKFLLQTEIANRVLEVVEARTAGIPFTEDEKKLLEFVASSGIEVRGDFGTRFERTILALSDVQLGIASSEAGRRDLVNEALHSKAIVKLRSLLGPVLKSKKRVAVLIDNLDKAWGKSADLELLSRLLLGLLSATGALAKDFEKEDFWRERVRLTVATFLRSDIFAYLQSEAREPDKIPASTVRWEDPAVLLRVIEERFLAARPEGATSAELWERFFCLQVNGMPLREYLTSTCLPRPRDLIFLCNAAMVVAADRGHERVEEEDFVSAELAYSRFAFEALLVENGITIELFQRVLFEFLGSAPTFTEDIAKGTIREAGVDEEDVIRVFERLKAVSFLGVETTKDGFLFPEFDRDGERARVLAEKYVKASNEPPRVTIHPAYRSYLEIK